jgi:hypothetical protein
MLLRRSRKHLHGASNKAKTEGTYFNSFYKIPSQPKKETAKKDGIACTTSHLKARNLHKK